MPAKSTARLAPAHWADAALEAMRTRGLEGMAVEPLARRLGVTKGSFYWHFDDREALLRATLERWEETSTEAIIADIAGLETPAAILTALAERVLAEPQHGELELVFSNAAAHPLVRPVLERVMDRR